MWVLSARGARRRAATGRQLFSCALPLLSHGGASANLRRRVRLQFLPPIGRQSHWMAGDADATAGEAAAARKRRDQRDELRSWRWQLLASAHEAAPLDASATKGQKGEAPPRATAGRGDAAACAVQRGRLVYLVCSTEVKSWVEKIIDS